MKKLLMSASLFQVIGFVMIGLTGLKAADDSAMYVHQGIRYTITQQYDSALSVFTRLWDQDPSSPIGPFFITAAYQSMMMDFETRQWEQEFLRYAERTIRLAQIRLYEHPDDAESRFCLGAAQGYQAFYLAKNGRYVAGIKMGLQAIADLHKTLALDSTFYDALLGIGSFKYWRSRIVKNITRMPYFDQRPEGIAMILQAFDRGRFSRWLALNNLAWIEIDAGNFARATEYADQGLAIFPNSRFFLWPAAEAYWKMADLEKAIEYYRLLLSSVQSEKINNHYNEILLHLKLAQAYQKLGAAGAAEHHCRMVLQLPADKEVRQRIREKRRQAKKFWMN